MLYGIIITIILIACVLLILVVLMQGSKSGASAQLGGQVTTQMFGAKQGADILERLTWGFFATIFTLVLLSNFTLERSSGLIDSPNLKRAREKKTALPTAPAPGATKPESKTETKTESKPAAKPEEKK